MTRAVLLLALPLATLLLNAPVLAHAPTTTTVEFDREIVRVLDNHCVACHHEHGPAPALVTYEQTYRARWQIRQAVLSRHMAPWAAVAGYGEFANDNSLTQREIDFISSWAESFGPRNNGAVDSGVAASPTVPKPVEAHSDFSAWAQGTPDLTLTLPAQAVPAAAPEHVQRTVLDPGLRAERWLNGLEYKPGARSVVHAAVFSVRETGQWLGSWTPWYGYVDLAPGLAYRLPTGAHIVAEVHYSGVGDAVRDSGTLGLYFAQAPPARVVSDLMLRAQRDTASPGTGLKLSATTILTQALNLLAVQPALGKGVQSIEISARSETGATQVLLFARDIPLEWPTPYVFRQAVSLPKGTRLSVIEHYAADAILPVAGQPVTFSGYAGEALPTAAPETTPAPKAAAQRFTLAGTVKSVDAAQGRLVIAHGEIPGYMGAMTMSYAVRKGESLQNVAAGDRIRSDVVVNDAGEYLENIEVTGKAE